MNLSLGVVVPMPMFPLGDWKMFESPMVEDPVNLGIVFVVPLPVTVCALAPKAAKPAMTNRMQMRFIETFLYCSDLSD